MSSTVLRESSDASARARPGLMTTAVSRAGVWITLAVITGFGLAIRLLPTLGSALPLNDGGLFTTMATDLQEDGFGLPRFTSYNRDGIPFAYPPLGIYLLAAVSAITGAAPIEVMRLLPVVFAAASIPLVYLVAARVLGSAPLALVAALAFSLLPRAYEWLIVGGGVTRAPGFVLALLGIWLFLRALDSPSAWHATWAGAALGLCGLTHPEAAVFAAGSIVLLGVARNRSWRTARRVGVAVVVAVAIVVPWVALIIGRHGLDPLLAASASRDLVHELVQRADFAITGATLLPILTAVGIAGVIAEVARGRYLLPLWLALPLLVVPAAAQTFAMVPWALLVAAAAGALYRFAPSRAVPIGAAVLLIAAFSAYLAPMAPQSPLRAMSADELQAMAWVGSETDSEAVVLVVPTTGWGRDTSNEWLPSITRRHSLLTVQGYEWTTRETWSSRIDEHEAALQCSQDTIVCLAPWLGESDFLYLPKGQRFGPFSPDDCCPGLRRSMAADPRLTVVYDGPGATIAAVNRP